MFCTSLKRYSLSQIHIAYCLLSCAEILKFHIPSFALMSPRNGPPDKSNSNRTAKVLAAVPITGILAAAALLSGFSSVIGSETAIAQQQNMTGTNVTAANVTAANVTAANVTAANVTGNQTATGSNQTGAAAATSGGNNNAGTTGGYP
jgi:hypothetical protein